MFNFNEVDSIEERRLNRAEVQGEGGHLAAAAAASQQVGPYMRARVGERARGAKDVARFACASSSSSFR